ncbi:universal stress protein [Adhaeribacter aquaticus]|uniref:universal stress protein n=1 Tax=Adhaeribacter aquaticus TaxID=299567 RepID=UPI000414397B|nr:universal stress protein [Adhaeribacter aquaticus]
MKNILVLTDFSENSVNAYRYAVQLAGAVKANLMLAFSSNGAIMTLVSQQQYSQMLHSFAKRYSCDSQIQVECLVSSDHWPEAVSKLISFHNPDLLVAGSGMLPLLIKDEERSLENSLAQCPVLWVPGQANFKSQKHLVFGTDFTDQDIAVVQQIKELASIFNAQVSAVHFYSQADKTRTSELKKGGEDLDWALGGIRSKYFLVENENIVQGLQGFARGIQPFPTDLFILATQDFYLAQQYFGFTSQEQEKNQAFIPLLNIYQKKKKACSGSCALCQKRNKPAIDKAEVL